MNPIRSTSDMIPVGKLGFYTITLVISTVGRTEKEARKIADMKVLAGPLSVGYNWTLVERGMESVENVVINDVAGPGWAGSSVYRGVPK